jgi:hypothetical protein
MRGSGLRLPHSIGIDNIGRKVSIDRSQPEKLRIKTQIK